MSLSLYSFRRKTRVQKFLPEHCNIIKQQSNGEKWYGFIFVITFAVFAPSLCFSTFYLLVSGRVIQIPSINVVQKLDGQQL